MSQEAAGAAAADTAEEEDESKKPKKDDPREGQEQRQPAWQARQDLVRHAAPALASTLIGGEQFGQTGGTHYGNTIFNFGSRGEAPRPASGPIPRTEVEFLAAVFRDCPSFHEALDRLRDDRVVVLTGGDATGRRSAALMLLFRLGAGEMRELEPPASPAALVSELDRPVGYVLCNWTTSRHRPLRALHVSGLRERLERTGGHLVITVEPSAVPADIPSVRWEPPPAEDMLRSHVAHAVGETAWAELSGLVHVKEFLDRNPPPRETAQFAARLAARHRGEIDDRELADYGEAATTARIDRWLTGETPKLLDKAFLLSLAVFDGAPYAVAAELGDGLFRLLQKIDDPTEPPRIPVFGSSREERLRLARAHGYMKTEVTDHGVLGHFVAEFQDERIARLLLHEVWNRHPSARPALVNWLQQLAKDGRPLVRTRAANAAAVLAEADFPSAMALLIEQWADSGSFGAWLTAANALTLAHLLGVPSVSGTLHSWCTGDHKSRRWTAIRAYGLLGPAHHEATLRALLDAVRRHPDSDDEDDEEARQLADALELLLLAVRGPVLAALAGRLTDRRVHAHALRAFLQACRQHEEDSTRPLVLTWYAEATAGSGTEEARHLITFWDALLGDRAHTREALAVLRGWILTADREPESEAALATLLPALAVGSANRDRVRHLLETVRDSDGARPQVAERLLAAIRLPTP
jgi:hypothetical protein